MESSKSSPIVSGLKGGIFACIGALWFGVGFGLLAGALISMVVPGNDVRLEFLGAIKIAAGLIAPFLVLGYPQWYVLHSLPSKVVTVLAVCFGVWLWLSGTLNHA